MMFPHPKSPEVSKARIGFSINFTRITATQNNAGSVSRLSLELEDRVNMFLMHSHLHALILPVPGHPNHS